MDDLLLSLGVPAAWIATLRLDVLLRLLLAALLGGAVGLERELSGKPAGLRTNLLICVGAALLTELSVAIGAAADADPARIAAQIVSGIGFIGAGTILHARGHVTGLTTAATLWVVAAIGIAVGARAYVEAAGTAALVLLALLALRRLEAVMERRHVRRRYAVALGGDGEGGVEALETALEGLGVRVRLEQVEREGDAVRLVLHVSGPVGGHRRVMRHLADAPRVRSAGRA